MCPDRDRQRDCGATVRAVSKRHLRHFDTCTIFLAILGSPIAQRLSPI
jgi:hypothetical protein